MSTERIVRHQLLRHGECELRIEAAPDIDGGEFALFGGRISCQFGLLDREVSALSIGLRADGYVLTGCHRQGAGDEASDARQQNVVLSRACGSNADDETGGR